MTGMGTWGASFDRLRTNGVGVRASGVGKVLRQAQDERGVGVRANGVGKVLRQAQDVIWRPFLRDPSDDMVLECAVASGSRYIATHNVKEFRRSQELGIQPIAPGHFLQHLETLP